jgi:hypothetical protein
VTSYPHTSQPDRDLIEDNQLTDVDNRVGAGHQAEHADERVAT